METTKHYQHVMIPLPAADGKHFYLNFDALKNTAIEINQFLNENSYMNESNFLAETIFPFEIKTNNATEGYYDDINSIYYAMSIHSKKQANLAQKRVQNLWTGYNMIFRELPINETNLNRLYQILSNGILVKSEQLKTGEIYRHAPVYIHYSNNLHQTPDMGVQAGLIEYYMDHLFEFINEDYYTTPIQSYIKSQIIHFYFVFVHPYFDINGRTSRTLSTWYLLNHHHFAFTLFNRHIPFTLKKYYTLIHEARSSHDLTNFITYMMSGILSEMKKEKMIHDYEEYFECEFDVQEKQTILYILTMNSHRTVKDFAVLYNRFNQKQKVYTVYQEFIIPLIEKGIIIKEQDTNSYINHNIPNFFFSLAPLPKEKVLKK